MGMFQEKVVAAIDAEIAQLSKIRKLLTRGVTSQRIANTKREKHKLSPEGRARIAAAQRARWAKQKKTK
jgi:hypothetical protein